MWFSPYSAEVGLVVAVAVVGVILKLFSCTLSLPTEEDEDV